MRARSAWAEGPLLPPGWRPDRDEPRDTSGDHHWVVTDPAGGVRLGDGTAVALRPLGPGDGKLLAAGFDRLSERSRYQRFLSPVPRLTSTMLGFLTSVDATDHRAWGALVQEHTAHGNAGPVGAGVVRWVRSRKDPAVADMAVTVIDDYQGRGLGALLQDVAIIDAFAFGIERFEGVVLAENVASRRMLARGGAKLHSDGGGVLAFTLELRPRMDRLRGSPLPAVIATQNRRADLTA